MKNCYGRQKPNGCYKLNMLYKLKTKIVKVGYMSKNRLKKYDATFILKKL